MSVRPLDINRHHSASALCDVPERPPRAPSRNSERGGQDSPVAAPPLLPGMVVPNVQRPSPTSPFSDWEAYIVSQTQSWDEHRIKMQKGTGGRIAWADQVPRSPPTSSTPGYVKARELSDSGLIARPLAVKGRKSLDSSAPPLETLATNVAVPKSSSKVAKLLSPKPRRSSIHLEKPVLAEMLAAGEAAKQARSGSDGSVYIPYDSSDRRASVHSNSSNTTGSEGGSRRFGDFLSPVAAALLPGFQANVKRPNGSSASGVGSEASLEPRRRPPSSVYSVESDVRNTCGPRPAFLDQYGLDQDSAESEDDASEGSEAGGETDVTTPRLEDEDRLAGRGPKILGAETFGFVSDANGSASAFDSPSPLSEKQQMRSIKPKSSMNSVDRKGTSKVSKGKGVPPGSEASPVAFSKNPFAASTSSLPSPPAFSPPLSPFSETGSRSTPKQKKSASGRSKAGSSASHAATTASILRSMPTGDMRRRREDRGSSSSVGSSSASVVSNTSKKSRRGYDVAVETIPPMPEMPVAYPSPSRSKKGSTSSSASPSKRSLRAREQADQNSVLSHSSNGSGTSSLSKVEGKRDAAPSIGASITPAAADKGRKKAARDAAIAAESPSVPVLTQQKPPARVMATPQTEWEDLQIERHLRAFGVPYTAAEAVVKLQRGELVELLDPVQETRHQQVSPHGAAALSALKDHAERLYVGSGSTYASLSHDLLHLARWDDTVLTATAASIYFFCWYRGLLMPLLFGGVAVLILRRGLGQPSDDELRAATQAQRERIAVIEAMERSVLGGVNEADQPDGKSASATTTACDKAKRYGASLPRWAASIVDAHEKVRHLVAWQTPHASRKVVALLLCLAALSWTLSPWMASRLPGLLLGLLLFVAAPIAERHPGLVAGQLRKVAASTLDELPNDAQYARTLLRGRMTAGIAPASQ